MEERKARIRQAAKEMGAEDMTDEQVEDSIKRMDHMLDQVLGCAFCLAPWDSVERKRFCVKEEVLWGGRKKSQEMAAEKDIWRST